MVNEFLDGNMAREFGETTDMIVVVVSDDQVIDLFEAGVLDGGHNASCIANGGVSTVSSIDKHGLSGRRHKQDGIAAFYVDHINVERLRSFGLRNSKRSGKDQN